MKESDLKEYLASCLDGLQEAAESLEEVIDQDDDINLYYEEIQTIYAKILRRYEN